MAKKDIYKGLKQLGGKTELPASPEKAILERVPNPQKDTQYAVRFTAPEFTSLCPIISSLITCRAHG
jgi:7-cyano-7-deazaguanine reductase